MKKFKHFMMVVMLQIAWSTGTGHAADVIHYDLHIVPDFSSRTVNLTAAVQIDNAQLERRFVFGLNDGYDSVEVSAAASAVAVERKRGQIVVTVEQPVRDLILNFQLKGLTGNSNDEARAVVTDSSLFLLWSDRFYPIVYDDWATVTTAIVLPEGFSAIAPGRLARVLSGGDETTYVFETGHPTVCFSVLADRRWIHTQRTINNIPMHTFLYPESQHFAEQIFQSSAEILAFYAEYYGPYAFDQFSFVTIDGINARRAFPGFIGYSPRYLEKEFTTTGHDAHETALLWWFYTLRGSGSGAFQWTEGFGDYAEFLYDETFRKPIPAIFRYFREQYLNSKPSEDVAYHELNGATPQKIVHGKYPWLMHLLRFAVGDEPFRKGMRLLFDRYRFRTFSMQEFIKTMEEGSGQSLQWWREDWLERKGAPAVVMRYDVRKSGDRFITTVILEQSEPPRYLPLEVGLKTENDMRLEKILLTGKVVKRVFKTDKKPKRVILDPNRWLPAKKKTVTP
ncbi:M1 family metallopeptidase [Calditrichota bacterium LG25]